MKRENASERWGRRFTVHPSPFTAVWTAGVRRGSPSQRPDPPRAARRLRAGRRGRHPRQGGLLRRARPLDRHLPRPRAHVLQGHRHPGRGRDRPGDQERRRLPQRQHDLRSHQLLRRAPRRESGRRAGDPGGCAPQLGRGCRRARARAPGDHPGSQAEARHPVRPGVTRPCTRSCSTATGCAAGGSATRRSSRGSPATTCTATTGPATSPGAPSWPSSAPSIRTRRSPSPALPTATGPPARAPSIPRRRSRRGREVRARTLRGRHHPGRAGAGLAHRPAARTRTRTRSTSRRRSSRRAAAAGSIAACGSPGSSPGSSASNYAPTELGVFSVGAELEPDRLPEVVEGIAKATARLTMLGPSAEELERARTLLRARWARRLESMEGRAGGLAMAEALEDVSLLDREYEELMSVTRRAGPGRGRAPSAPRRRIRPSRTCRTARVPISPPTRLAAGVRGDRAGAASARRRQRTGRATARRVAGKVEGGVLLSRLPGVDLLVRRKSGVPLVTLGVYVPKREFDPPAQAGLGALLVRSAVRGAGELDSGALAYAFERLGGSLTPSAASDWLGFGTSVLTEHLGGGRQRCSRAVLTSPRLAEADVAAERGLMIAEAEQVADDMFRYPFQLAFAEAFGEEGYGLPVGRVAPHPAGRERGRRPGLASPGAARRAAHGGRGGRRGSRARQRGAGGCLRRPDRPRRPRRARLERVAWIPGGEASRRCGWSRREKAQAALAMAFPGPARRDADRAAAQVWAAVASGLGGRLFEALRDRRSLAYTVVASAWQKARGGALLTYIATSPEREEEAREQMLIELERFTREPVSDAELRQAVNYLAGQAEVSRQNASAVAGEILEAWLSGIGPAASWRIRRLRSARSRRRMCADRAANTWRRRAGRKGVVRGTGVARPPVLAAPGLTALSSGGLSRRMITSIPRPTSAGARAMMSTRHIPSSGDGVQHDVAVAAEHADRDPSRALPEPWAVPARTSRPHPTRRPPSPRARRRPAAWPGRARSAGRLES